MIARRKPLRSAGDLVVRRTPAQPSHLASPKWQCTDAERARLIVGGHRSDKAIAVIQRAQGTSSRVAVSVHVREFDETLQGLAGRHGSPVQ